MTTSVYSSRKTARASFYIAFAASMLLILLLFSSFFRPAVLGLQRMGLSSDEDADPHSVIYQDLHQRMQHLNAVCAAVAKQRSAANLALLQQEESRFFAGIDSVRTAIGSLPEAGKEQELTALVDAFSRAAEKQANLARGVAETSPVGLAELKNQLQQKEQQIAELESQNKLLAQEKEAALADVPQNSPQTVQPIADNGGAAWKEKYDRLKQTVDKLKAGNDQMTQQANQLRKSYRDVVEDNRRLLAQLQAARAGKN